MAVPFTKHDFPTCSRTTPHSQHFRHVVCQNLSTAFRRYFSLIAVMQPAHVCTEELIVETLTFCRWSQVNESKTFAIEWKTAKFKPWRDLFFVNNKQAVITNLVHPFNELQTKQLQAINKSTYFERIVNYLSQSSVFPRKKFGYSWNIAVISDLFAEALMCAFPAHFGTKM